MKLNYRPEIDGLRGIAVLPVILFHAGFSLFQGGYVGVDIFFVVSGYLITSIILKDLETNNFSFLNFYQRRARRILPALIVTLLISLAFCFILPPDDLKNFCKSIISSLTFWSNFQFSFESGYFATPSEYKPLLHTWSLSIEEQFYITYPIFFAFFYKINKKLLLFLLTLILITSLFFSQWGGNINFSYPYLEKKLFFYSETFLSTFMMPFGRVWELAIGGVSSILLNYHFNFFDFKNNKYRTTYLNILSFVGIILIFFSIFFLSKYTPYPSFYALLPTIGTVLLILFCQKETFIFKILSNNFLVTIGLISYSAYLIHYPTFSFIKYLNINLGDIFYYLIIILIFFISFINWKLVETPFRKQKISIKNFILFIFISYLFLISVSSYIYVNDGLKNREAFNLPNKILQSFDEKHKGYECFSVPYIHKNDDSKNFCVIGKSNKKQVDFIVYGDSHIVSFYPLLNKLGKLHQKKGLFVGYPSCPPLLDIYLLGRKDRRKFNCNQLNKKIFETVINGNIKNVILLSRWTDYVDTGYFNHISQPIDLKPDGRWNISTTRKTFEYAFNKTLESYKKKNINVFIVRTAPEQKLLPKLIYYRSFSHDDNKFLAKLKLYSLDLIDHTKLQRYTTKIFNQSKMKYESTTFIDFDDIFCDKIINKCLVGNVDYPFYMDEHLNTIGVNLTYSIFDKYFKNF